MRIHFLDDDCTIQTIFAVSRRQVARYHDGTCRDAAIADFAGGAVIDLGGLADIHAHGNHRVFFDNDTFHHFRAGADEAIVFNNGRVGLHRLQYAAYAHAAGQMNVLTDLCAGTYGCPGIHHRTFIDIGADVDVGGHQHHVPGDKAAAARHCRRHHAEAAFGEVFGSVIGKLGRNLVVELHVGAGGHCDIVFQTEGQQNGLLDPLVDLPCAIQFLRNAQAAAIQLLQHMGYGFADFCGSGFRRKAGAVFPGLVDDLL